MYEYARHLGGCGHVRDAGNVDLDVGVGVGVGVSV